MHLCEQRILQAVITVPAMTSGFSPTRLAGTRTKGRIANRPARISASAASTAGAGTPARSKYAAKKAPPPLSASA